MGQKTHDSKRHFASRSEEIAAIVRDEILRGQYRPGERLPSERDLSARFDSSRGAVREAFKKLEQLGIASIQPGGARVVAVDDCTLDVLGPLLDLDDLPDAKLVDEVLQMFGVLMEVAARLAIEKATDEQLAEARDIAMGLEAQTNADIPAHAALRQLGHFFVEVADHLVLKLIGNGLRMQFMSRLHDLGVLEEISNAELAEVAQQLKVALDNRDAAEVGAAMQRLNRNFREGASKALASARYPETRISA